MSTAVGCMAWLQLLKLFFNTMLYEKTHQNDRVGVIAFV